MNLQALAEDLLDEVVSRYPIGFRPHLAWRAMRVTAGLADWPKREIRLSSKLLTDADRLQSTLLHEYAHFLAIARHGTAGRGHGPAWKQAMRDLGEPPERCHAYEVERLPKTKRYGCERCGAEFLRARKLPARRKFLHAGCGGPIRYLGDQRP